MTNGLIASRHFTILVKMSSKYHGLPDIVGYILLLQKCDEADN